MATSSRPVIGIVADVRDIEGMPYHTAQDKYLTAIWEASGAMPVVLPAFGESLDMAELVRSLDGLLLTGCVSNIEPWRYGGPMDPPAEPYDPARDATVFPLIPMALDAGLPILAVCRGFQELNVALGGTLHPRIHELPGRLDHRAPYGKPIPELYAPAHSISIVPGSELHRLAEGADETRVNSLHWQGIDRLADRLIAEAKAPDGTIEAVRVRETPNLALGVQWHPEWKVMDNALSRNLFGTLGDAARARSVARQHHRAAA
jgi:putative glutamine amidotransferase